MGAMPSPVSRRLLRRGLIALAVVVVIAGAATAFVLLHTPGNVSNPGVAFDQPTTTVAPVVPSPRHKRHRRNNFQWPWYGYNNGRTRFFSAFPKLRPPMHIAWAVNQGTLLEFPPVIYHETLFLIGDNAVAKAISIKNGSTLWHRKVGTLAAASPAISGKAGLVMMPVLSTHGSSAGAGRFVALSMKTGRMVWQHPLPAGSESSPIVQGKNVFFGDQGGTLWSMSVKHGHVNWTYHARGAIKGGPALVNGVLYFGDYSGRAYAVRASNGHQIWAVGTNGAQFGFGSGQFYTTPAVAYGRVYMGNTDGRVYSFGIRSGALAWATGTGAYVYASASVADPPGLGPTIYVGSYDGNFYAFNARTGAVRWRHHAGGRISGSSTVIGNVVYYSDLGSKTTAGLNVRTGRQVFSFPDGAFTPVVADYHAIYLDGYSKLYALLPGRKAVVIASRRHHHHHRAATAHKHNHKRTAAARRRHHRAAARKHRRRAAARNHRRRAAHRKLHHAAHKAERKAKRKRRQNG
jgi:outer membrane protein assembly factor BamB